VAEPALCITVKVFQGSDKGLDEMGNVKNIGSPLGDNVRLRVIVKDIPK